MNINLTALSGKRFLLAHSGGLDSCVLANLLLEASVDFSVAHCNFQLRGDDSKGDEAFIEAYAKENNLSFHSVRFDTKIFAQENKLTIQEAARKLRYDWFDSFIDYKKQQLFAIEYLFSYQIWCSTYKKNIFLVKIMCVGGSVFWQEI